MRKTGKKIDYDLRENMMANRAAKKDKKIAPDPYAFEHLNSDFEIDGIEKLFKHSIHDSGLFTGKD